MIPANLYLDFTAVLASSPPPPLASALASYRRLIGLLPPASRYLLLYLLDFLAVFARSAQHNLMSASNLATVFQPGLVSTRSDGSPGALLGFPGFPGGKLPGGDKNGMRAGSSGAQAQGVAGEHGRGKEVLEFLIEQQAHFVLAAERPVPEKEGREMDGTHSPRAKRAEPTNDSGYGAASSSGRPLTPRATTSAESSQEGHGLPGSSLLARKGSEKSVERRRLRKSHDGQGGKVKRSRTLPGRHSTGGGEGTATSRATLREEPAAEAPTTSPKPDRSPKPDSPTAMRTSPLLPLSSGTSPSPSPLVEQAGSAPGSPLVRSGSGRGSRARKEKQQMPTEKEVRKAVADVGR